MKKIILIILSIFLLTGCSSDYKELNDLLIVTALEIDKVEDNYRVIIQVVNPKNQNNNSSANQTDFITYESTGITIQDALRNIISESTQKIYGIHSQILVISESLAKEDLTSIYDFFFRNISVRKEFYVIIDTTDDNQKLLQILTPLINLSSQSIYETLITNNKYMGVATLVKFSEMMDIYLDDNKELLLPTIYIKGNNYIGTDEENLETSDTDANLVLGNLAIFKDEKLLGYLTKEESISANIINNNAQNVLFSHKCDNDNYISEEITINSSDIKIDTDNKKVSINIKGSGYISEYNCNEDLTNISVIKEINDNLNLYVKEYITDSIYSINSKYNTDIYGIRDVLYKKHYKYYKEVNDNYYEEFFNNLSYEVNVNLNLSKKGNIIGGAYEK